MKTMMMWLWVSLHLIHGGLCVDINHIGYLDLQQLPISGEGDNAIPDLMCMLNDTNTSYIASKVLLEQLQIKVSKLVSDCDANNDNGSFAFSNTSNEAKAKLDEFDEAMKRINATEMDAMVTEANKINDKKNTALNKILATLENAESEIVPLFDDWKRGFHAYGIFFSNQYRTCSIWKENSCDEENLVEIFCSDFDYCCKHDGTRCVWRSDCERREDTKISNVKRCECCEKWFVLKNESLLEPRSNKTNQSYLDGLQQARKELKKYENEQQRGLDEEERRQNEKMKGIRKKTAEAKMKYEKLKAEVEMKQARAKALVKTLQEKGTCAISNKENEPIRIFPRNKNNKLIFGVGILARCFHRDNNKWIIAYESTKARNITWDEFMNGYGKTRRTDYWIGFEKLRLLAQNANYELSIETKIADEEPTETNYGSLRVIHGRYGYEMMGWSSDEVFKFNKTEVAKWGREFPLFGYRGEGGGNRKYERVQTRIRMTGFIVETTTVESTAAPTTNTGTSSRTVT